MSAQLRNALQIFVQYYPEQDLSGDIIEVPGPYMILVQHYDELSEFGRRCEQAIEGQLCQREVDVPAHIRLLLAFLDDKVMDNVRAEQERNQRGATAWKWCWMRFKPGSMLFHSKSGSGERLQYGTPTGLRWKASIVHSTHGRTLVNPPKAWEVLFWKMQCYPEYTWISRRTHSLGLRQSDDELRFEQKLFRKLDQATLEGLMVDPVADPMIAAGKAYWSLLPKSCMFYTGPTATFPYTKVDCSVMSDLEQYTARASRASGVLQSGGLCVGDIREWISDCSCFVCKSRKSSKAYDEYSMARFNSIKMTRKLPSCCEQETVFEMLVYLLLPSTIPAYVFRTRTWETLWTVNFTSAKFNQKMINDLVMDERRLQSLKSLSKSVLREDKMGKPMTTDRQWSADFEREKAVA